MPYGMKTKLLNLGFFAKLFHKMLAHLERFAIIIFTKWCTFQTDKDMFHIPSLYDEIDPILKQEKIHIAESTFKNMLMESSTQSCDLEKRLKVINLIFEYLNPEKINATYEGVKLAREKEIRSIMGLLKSDYRDKREYLPEETFLYEMENLPKDMKTYWESWKKD